MSRIWNSALQIQVLEDTEMKKVKTGQVTYAVRDTSIDGMEIRQGNIMGLDDSTIRAVGDSVEDTAYELLVNMIDRLNIIF